MDKIFYSWQSDLPADINRGFLEEVLVEVIARLGESADELYEPIRDVELDKDTKGVPGAPPVAETIFRKITECSVFVPDLTFVGHTEKKRPIPNPNVLIEYGWPLANCGHARIVAITNTKFGELTAESVPFDFRHHRWPVTYYLEPAATEDVRKKVKNELVETLLEEIGGVLRAHSSDPAGSDYEQLHPKSRISSFLDEGDVLCTLVPFGEREKASEIIWHDGPQIFLRTIPRMPTTAHSPLELRKLMREAGLTPLGRVTDTWTEGNEWGAVTFEAKNVEKQDTANRIVQAADQGEIWAIDGFTLREYETVPFLEIHLANRLAEYLGFAKNQLGVTSDVKVIAGLTGIRGRDMWRPDPPKGTHYTDIGKKWGVAVRDNIAIEIEGIALEPDGEVPLEVHGDFAYPLNNVLELHAYKALIPFFEQLFGIFQVDRPDFLPK